jgi:chromate transporter
MHLRMNKRVLIISALAFATLVGIVLIISQASDLQVLLDLAKVFGYTSLLTIGGGLAAYPEIKTLSVETHQWLTGHRLLHLYSVSQLAPGPNMMMVVAIGQMVAGFPGALVSGFAFFIPTSILTLIVGRFWNSMAHNPWRGALQRGLAPVSLGLLLAGCITIGLEVLTDWINILLCLIVFGLLMKTKINPSLLILAAAIIGLLRFHVLGQSVTQ